MFFTFNKDKQIDLTLDPSHWLESAMISSLFTQRGGPNPGYWAKGLLSVDVGSTLHELKRAKLSEEMIEEARDAASLSLQWLQEHGHVESLEITPTLEGAQLQLEINTHGGKNGFRFAIT